jgi:hypothetical protein
MHRALLNSIILHAAATLSCVVCGCASKPVARFVGHEAPIIVATFSTDGGRLASIGEDGTVRVWDVRSTRELARARIEPPPRLYTMNEMAFAPDGNAVAFAARGNSVYCWNWAANVPPRLLVTLRGIPSVIAFSPDGTRVIAASGGYGPAMTSQRPQKPVMQPLDIRIFDLRAGRVVREVRDDDCAALSVAIAPDGARFAVVCMTADGRPVRDLPTTRSVQARLSIRDLPGGEELVGVEGEGNPLLTFTRDGRYVLVGNRVRQASSGELVREVVGQPRMLVNEGRQVLVLQQGMGVPWDIGLAATPWIRKNRVDLKSGRVFEDGRLASGELPPMPLFPPLSPDGRFLLDYNLNLWRLPR